MEENRTQNTIRNVKTGAIVQMVNKVMAFVVQTVFIMMLNTEYLGVNGLFTNILTVLSFAELGIGTAIIFSMYKPVAEQDKEKIKSLMLLYKKAYNIIGVTVFLLGLCVIPFMSIIIKEAPNIRENLNLIYILFLLNTSISYFFTYKKSIIYAHQKQSIIDNINSIFYLIKSLLLILFLVLTRNYIVYLVIQIIITLVENVIIAIKANKLYPYLKEKSVKRLEKEEQTSIFVNVKSLIVYKLGSVIMNGTDNILISSMISVGVVGLCSNYVLIINSIKSIIFSALNGVTASVGNLNAVGEPKQKEKVFYQITFIDYIVYSFCAVAFIVLLNPFITLWLGEKYLLGMAVPIALAVSFYIDGLRNPGFTYRTTLGLFKKGKATPYIGAITNIVFSILLCKIFGVAGIFIATSIAQLLSYSWIDPYLIHKYEFKTSVKKYYKKYFYYTMVFIVCVILTLIIANFIQLEGVIGLLLKGIVVCLVPNVVNLVCFKNTEEFQELRKKFIRPFWKKLV
ncbi:MAG: sugar translocase [Clostridia bacterium]|jgi:O-antigen/teichoic acid export membrane protein|nr:sugar translocase [Clostridia bacterium]